MALPPPLRRRKRNSSPWGSEGSTAYILWGPRRSPTQRVWWGGRASIARSAEAGSIGPRPGRNKGASRTLRRRGNAESIMPLYHRICRKTRTDVPEGVSYRAFYNTKGFSLRDAESPSITGRQVLWFYEEIFINSSNGTLPVPEQAGLARKQRTGTPTRKEHR